MRSTTGGARWAAAALGAAALVAATVSCGANGSSGGSGDGSGGGSEAKTVRFYLAGDVNIRDLWSKTIIPGFKKANPGYDVDVTFSEHGINDTTTFSRLAASVKTEQDPGMDLFEGSFTQSAAQAELTQEITDQEVASVGKVSPTLMKAIDQRGVPYRGSSVVLAYDSTKVQNPPKTVSDLLAWIKAHPGKFTYNSPNSGGSGYAFAQTILDLNMPADVQQQMLFDDNYDTDLESNWDKGWSVLKSLNQHVYHHVYPNGNEAVLQLLGKGQIEMAPVWSDQALSGLDSGLLPKNIELEQVQDPPFTGGAVYLGLPVNSPRKDAVYKLEEYLLQPDVQVEVVNAVQGYPGIESKYLPSDVQQKFASLDTSNLRPNYSAKFQNDVKQQWQQKVPS